MLRYLALGVATAIFFALALDTASRAAADVTAQPRPSQAATDRYVRG